MATSMKIHFRQRLPYRIILLRAFRVNIFLSYGRCFTSVTWPFPFSCGPCSYRTSKVLTNWSGAGRRSFIGHCVIGNARRAFCSIPFESNDPFYNIWLPNFKNITFCRSCFIVLFKVILKSFLLHWLNAKVWLLNTKPYFSVVQYTVIYCTRWF